MPRFLTANIVKRLAIHEALRVIPRAYGPTSITIGASVSGPCTTGKRFRVLVEGGLAKLPDDLGIGCSSGPRIAVGDEAGIGLEQAPNIVNRGRGKTPRFGSLLAKLAEIGHLDSPAVALVGEGEAAGALAS